MPQENLNKIWKAGKYFEQKPEQPAEQPVAEIKPSNVKRKINVAKAFMPQQEDPFKKKVEAVLKGIEKTEPEPTKEEEKPVPANAEVIVGTGQDEIGKGLATGKSIYVKGNTGWRTGVSMSSGNIHVKGDAGKGTGYCMSGGEIHIKGSVGDMTGDHMSCGEIHVKKDAKRWTGDSMSGGILRIDGDVSSFDKTAFTPGNKGTIIWKEETIWENGQKVEPGWTNLKVEEKIAE